MPLKVQLKRLPYTFEPQGSWDFILIPWWIIRYIFAWLWWKWATWQKIRKGVDPKWASMFGRHDDPAPAVCERCLWTGPVRWLVHTYYPVGFDDVEPTDECPRCGNVV